MTATSNDRATIRNKVHICQSRLTRRRESDFRKPVRSEEHTSELQSQSNLVCRLLLEKKNIHNHAGGMPFGPQEMAAVGLTAHELGLAVDLDGARTFHASVGGRRPSGQLLRHVDSVTV